MSSPGKIERRLAELAIELPSPKRPVANYAGCKRSGDLLYVSGLVSVLRGAVGAEVSKEEGYEAARETVINMLAIVKDHIGDLDLIASVDKLLGFVHSAPDFTEQPLVINGASDVLVEIFGESGRHSRTATGVMQCPFGAAVQLEMTLRLQPA